MHAHRDREHKICLSPYREAVFDLDYEQEFEYYRGFGGSEIASSASDSIMPEWGSR